VEVNLYQLSYDFEGNQDDMTWMLRALDRIIPRTIGEIINVNK